jgi:hypothetical protein
MKLTSAGFVMGSTSISISTPSQKGIDYQLILAISVPDMVRRQVLKK